MVDPQGTVAAVRAGRNGRLFLGAQDGFDLDTFSGGRPLDSRLLGSWRRSLTRRGRALGERGIPYFFFLVPDAPSVYPEDLPDDLAKDFIPPGQIFIDAMGYIENVTFIYPLADLQAAKGGLEIYKKTDSHWTTFGSYVAYRSLLKALRVVVPCRTIPARDVGFTFRRGYGDLGSLTDPEQDEENPIGVIAGPEPAAIRQMSGVARQTATHSNCKSGTADCRALFFRDSFMTDLAPYVARSFTDVLTVGTTTRVLMDAVDKWGADVVISEVAERKLVFQESDHQLEGFETSFGADYSSEHGKQLLQARIQLGDRPAAALQVIETCRDWVERSPAYAFSASLIYEANANVEQASTMARKAIEVPAPSASALALAARTALARGQTADAAEFATSAVHLASYNGYFHELRIYCLMQNNAPELALSAAGEALRTINDHPNLWYWASVLHAQANDTPAALTCIHEALAIDPLNDAYRAQLAKLGYLI